MQTADGKSTLNSDKVTSRQSIDSITTNTIGSSFTGNTWGYTLDTNTVSEASIYKPVPTSSDMAIKSTSSGTNMDNYNLGFGIHIDNTLPSGAYYNDIVVSVVANPKVITSLSDLNFMQDMTNEICANTAEGYTKQLIDTRDSKSYWVAKMKDGNCWMTQNLALDITTEGLKAIDTDITSDWNERSTGGAPLDTLNIGEGGVGSSTSTSSWRANTYQLVNPTATESCGDKITDLATCVEKGILTVTATDDHYLLGNYYTWNYYSQAGGPSDLGQSGYYWSDRQEGWNYHTKWMSISADELNTNGGGNGHDGDASSGRSVRCVAR